MSTPDAYADVIIATDVHMPAGEATAHRMRALALALANSGLKVAVVGRGDESSDYPFEQANNVSYHLWLAGKSSAERLGCAVEHYLGGRMIRLLKGVVDGQTRVLITNHSGVPALLRLFKLARRHNIQVVTDVTEWWWMWPLRAMQLPLLPFAIEHMIRNRYTYSLPGRLITICRALSDFYLARGCEVFRLPPLLDLREERWRHTETRHKEDGRMHLLFAGWPLRERWDVILGGLLEINRLGIPAVLEVLGVARERFCEMVGSQRGLLDRCGEFLFFHGRVPSEQVTRIIAGNHFGVLVRDDAPWSRGCFPSKVPEFLALGVPMVFNPNSDLEEYIRDNFEGIRINSPTVESLVDGLRRAWESLQNGRWKEMRALARERALTSFDCLSYASSLRSFLRI
jgi:glycosyltransferase involved in cell wall biosynthesis